MGGKALLLAFLLVITLGNGRTTHRATPATTHLRQATLTDGVLTIEAGGEATLTTSAGRSLRLWGGPGRLAQGIAYFYVERDREGAKKFEVETERAIASIKGIIFKVEADKDVTTLSVSEDTVGFTDKGSGKSVDVLAFQKATAGAEGLKGPEQFNFMTDPYLTDASSVQFIQSSGN